MQQALTRTAIGVGILATCWLIQKTAEALDERAWTRKLAALDGSRNEASRAFMNKVLAWADEDGSVKLSRADYLFAHRQPAPLSLEKSLADVLTACGLSLEVARDDATSDAAVAKDKL